MYRLLFPLIIIFSITFTQEDGEVIKNVTATQRTDGSKILDIYYDLEEHELYPSFYIYVMVEWPEVDHTFYLTSCGGDVWHNIFPGEDKHIYCQLTSEAESENLSGQFFINVHADADAVSELPDSFEFETINVDNEIYPTTLIDYDYDLMKKEVTVAQYVEFLNALLASAVSINNSDHDGWVDIEGGETFHRTYNFENGTSIQVQYSNPGGDDLAGNSIDADNPGFGRIYGYGDIEPSALGMLHWTRENDEYFWIALYQVSDEDTYPKIQFSSSGAGADDFSFFISPGKANHPVVDVSPTGADAFADFYGLRIPTREELVYPLYSGSFMFNDECVFDLEYWNNNFCSSNSSIANVWSTYLFENMLYDPCDSWNFSCEWNTNTMGDYTCEELNDDFENCSTSPVGGQSILSGAGPMSYDIYDLFGNVKEHTYSTNINEDIFYFYEDNTVTYLTFYHTANFGGSYQTDPYAVLFEQDIWNLSFNSSSWESTIRGWSPADELDHDYGFRCARSIPGSHNE